MFDGSSIEGFVRDDETDMFLYPDLDTFEIFPWRPQQGKVARLICDVYRPDGTPFEGDPRYVLRKALNHAKNMGYNFFVGPECEFFLFHLDDQGLPTTTTHEKAGYFDVGPVDFAENVRRDIVLNLEEMGFEIEASHHEIAPGQHEIDFHYNEGLITADKYYDLLRWRLKPLPSVTAFMLPLCQSPRRRRTAPVCTPICLSLRTGKTFLLTRMERRVFPKSATPLSPDCSTMFRVLPLLPIPW